MKRIALIFCFGLMAPLVMAQEWNDPITTSDWNQIWKSSFVQSNNGQNAPESSGWFWGLNMNHSSNSATYRYNGQLAIKNLSTSPTMYFRSTNVNGSGTWAKVVHTTNGQTNVSSNLSVSGDINGTRILVDNPSSTSDWNQIWQSGFFQSNDATNAPEASGWFWGLNMNHSSNSSSYRYNGQLAIKNSSSNPTLYFRSTNVSGVGTWARVLTNTGNQRMTGTLTVDGSIRTEEVKVEIVNGPDYVFEPDYELRTLKATKAFIEANKHLPEIPPAREMEANGVELGVMNMRLLKKIEELTLYQIKLMEQLESQNKELQVVKKELESLKKQ